jgi:hypothetical protein
MKCFLVVLLQCCLLFAKAQTEAVYKEYGDVSLDELKLATCSFDANASAIKLIDYRKTSFEPNGGWWSATHIYHQRIKVLNEKGVAEANIKFRYWSKDNRQRVYSIKACSYNLNDGGAMVKQEISNSDINKTTLNERWTELSFAMPNVKPGTVVEFTYSIAEDLFSDVDDWFFQSDMPTAFSQCLLDLNSTISFQYALNKSARFPVDIRKEDRGRYMAFTMKRVPGMTAEPFMTSPRYFLQHVDFQMTEYYDQNGSKKTVLSTWKEMAKELIRHDYFGKELKRNLGHGDELKKYLADPQVDAKVKMIWIYDYLKKMMKWNGENTIFFKEGIKEVWSRKTGTLSEINMVMAHFFRQANLEVYPLLCCTKRFGKVNKTYPFLYQFNTVMAYVKIGKERFILSLDRPERPYFLTPENVSNTTAFLVDEDNYELFDIPDNSKASQNLISITGVMNEQGIINATGNVLSYDYAKLERAGQSNSSIRNNFFNGNGNEISIDSFSVMDRDSLQLPLHQQAQFKVKSNLNGDYLTFNPAIFSGMEKNIFTAENRFSDIDFGARQNLSIFTIIDLPPNFMAEELPKSSRLLMPDTSISITRIFQIENGQLQSKINIESRRSLFSRDEYWTFREFFKKMFDMLNEPVVFKLKK